MAIQTQGHQVQVMPTYTPMDPRLVATDFSGLTRGALSSIELIDALAKQRAFQQAQAELAATREGRLGAQNAQNLATINLAPQRNLADIALAQQQATLAPLQTKVGQAQGGDQLARFALTESLRPITNETAALQANTANSEASVNSQLEDDKAQLEYQKVQDQLVNAPKQQQLTLAKLNQDIESITNDKALTDQQKIATIRNLNASALQSEAAARRADRDEADKVDPIKELSQLQLEIQRLEGTQVINPNADNQGTPMPIIQYDAQTRGPQGDLLQVNRPGWFNFGQQNVALNPEAERIRQQLKILRDRRDSLTKALVSQPSAPSVSVPSAQPAKASQGPKNITSKAEFDALKPGESFIFNGKQGVKTTK